MSAVKRIYNGDYTIYANTGNIRLDGLNVIASNLIVTNVSFDLETYANSTLVFNYTAASANAAAITSDSGIVVQRGATGGVYRTTANLQWSEANVQWEASDSLGNRGPLLTSYTPFQLEETTSNPVGVAGYAVITANTASSGAGLYVNTGGVTGELTTSKIAKKYAIIFG